MHAMPISDTPDLPDDPPIDPGAMAPGQRIQEPYLNNLRQLRKVVVIYLVNGVKLAGRVTSFDQHTVALDGNERQVINKHAIATIMPAPPRPAVRKPRDPGIVRRNHLGLPIKEAGAPTVSIRPQRRYVPAD